MATLFENELVLPGVITEILPTYSEGYDTSLFGTTESLVIIGTAFNGPVGRPVEIYSPEHAKYIFGDSFDPKTRKEATLVPEIYNAWDRGTRTIYAVRVSGKDMYKDYNLAVESRLKLRLSSVFPSNINKDCYFVFEATQGQGPAGTFNIYKPASKATITEKMQGVLDGSDSILVNSLNLDVYSLTKNSKLSDAIRIFNENLNNNGLRLSIVNEEGADVTNTDKDAHALSLGDMFPGLYTIARNANANGVIAATDVDYVNNETVSAYKGFEGALWKKLVLNSDINAPYPIYAVNNEDLVNKILSTGVIADEKYDWVKVPGNVNKVYKKDNVDYEEVELNDFELYKKLGSGFAKTAKIQEIEKKDPEGHVTGTYYKVIESPHGDENRILPIEDGIYSILENYGTDYRVLTCANAETRINSRLPKKDEFKKTNGSTLALNDGEVDRIAVKANVEEKDFTAAKDYIMTIEQLELDKEEIFASFLEDKKYKRVPTIQKLDTKLDLKDGQLAILEAGVEIAAIAGRAVVDQAKAGSEGMITTVSSGEENNSYKLCKYNKKTKAFEIVSSKYFSLDAKGNVKDKFAISTADGKLIPLSVAPRAEVANGTYPLTKETLEADKYVIVESEIVNIAKTTTENLIPVIGLQALLNFEEGNDFTLAYIDRVPATDANSKSIVKVVSNKLDWCTYEEFVEDLNEEHQLSKLFSFSLKDPVFGPADVSSKLTAKGVDRGEPTYDTNKYIPYTTSDNFARQLAQHCMYTSLKTFPTHGVIGCEKLTGVTLNAIANKVEKIYNLNLDLHVKKPNGNDLLDKNNMPYPIGRCLSVTFIQYGVTTGNGYTYISNGAAGYAGMISTLPVGKSSTNQPFNIPTLSYELSQHQLGLLSNKGFIVCKNSNKGIAIADGVTQAPVDSPFVRLATTKTMNIVDKVLRAAIEPFIGLQDTLANRNSLETSIKSELNKLLDNILRAYDFKLSTEANSQRLGVIFIDYAIAPTNEIKEVRNRIEVR